MRTLHAHMPKHTDTPSTKPHTHTWVMKIQLKADKALLCLFNAISYGALFSCSHWPNCTCRKTCPVSASSIRYLSRSLSEPRTEASASEQRSKVKGVRGRGVKVVKEVLLPRRKKSKPALDVCVCSSLYFGVYLGVKQPGSSTWSWSKASLQLQFIQNASARATNSSAKLSLLE